jgi:hypothetical protein
MHIYLPLLVIVVICGYLARETKSVVIARFLLGITFIFMVLVAAVRDKSVGTDTSSYLRYFNNIRTFDDVLANGEKMGEYGFWILTWLAHLISDQYFYYFLVIAVIVVGCYQWAIVKYSVHIGISFFAFITTGLYLFFFNGARQGIAAAICALAIGPLLKNNFKKYIGFILLAFLFHKTAMFMVPCFYFFNKPNTFKNNLIIFIIGCITIVFYQTIVERASQIDTRYAGYAAIEQGGGFIMAGFNFVLGMFFLIYKKFVRIDRVHYDCFLNMYIFGMMISLVSSLLKADPSGFVRFSLYLDIAGIFLWPIVFKNLTTRLSIFIFGFVFIWGFIIFFVLTTLRFSNLAPYAINPYVLSR